MTLSERQWKLHVIQKRPWMNNHLAAVKSTIRNPDFICRDKDRPDREAFFAKGLLNELPDDYLKVVVQFDQDRGTVITVFPATKQDKGEVKIWPS